MKKKSMKSLNILTRKDWLVFAGILVLFAGLIIWMTCGTIDTSVTSVGVFSTYEDSVEVHYPGNGVLARLFVSEGTYVNKGDLIATVYDTDKVSIGDVGTIDERISRIRDVRNEIRSEVNGYVSGVDCKEWAIVTIDTPIVHICKASDDEGAVVNYVYARASGNYIDQIKEGVTRVSIAAENHDYETFGYLTGTVIKKSATPQNNDILEKRTGSKDAADYLMVDDDDGYLVMIRLDVDPVTGEPKFSKKQPEGKLSINEECEVTFILKTNHPYEIIFQTGG